MSGVNSLVKRGKR